jgi:hypothetical protein
MHFEDTIEAPQLQLPADLLAEVSRRNKGRATDYRVDGWKPSFMERVLKIFGLS